MPFPLLCIGHPLLDLQVRNGQALLEKYGLKSNDGILAQEKHAGLYNEILGDHEIHYVAGGAAQNSARGAQYILPAESVAFIGSVGDDDLAEQLREANRREGLRDIYQVQHGSQTGACAVILTGHDRSLVTSLRSARLLDRSHFESAHVSPFVDQAKIFYVEGYVLSHAAEIVLDLAKAAAARGQIFALNISAPYIAQYYHDVLSELIPFCDILFANESEAEAWAVSNGHPDQQALPSVAVSLASLPILTPGSTRTVIITHGSQSTIWVNSANLEDVRTHPVHRLRDEDIVDTNGAGDAFSGGFLGALVAGRSTEECVEVGHQMAAMCIGQVGPQYKYPKVQIL